MTTIRLAIDGGEPAYAASPPSWPLSDVDVQLALQRAFADGSWGKYDGPHIQQLAKQLAEMHLVPFVLPCCSGTFAVELALRGLRVGPGDEVILAGYDFPGNFRAIEAIGAIPTLVDLTSDTWCLDVETVENAISTKTRAVIASHLHGGLADMKRLREIADARGIAIVEDACQSPGAFVQGRVAGTWGDVGVLSFGGSKLLTAGRGGAIVTNREDVWQRAKIFGERGNQAFPLSELQAAVLIPQLLKLADRNAHRLRSVDRLLSRMESITAFHPGRMQPEIGVPSFYKLAWRLVSGDCGEWSREQVITAVQAEGIALDAGFRGFVQRGSRCRRFGALSRSKAAADSTVLLHHPVLLESPDRIDLVAEGIRKVWTAACSRSDTSQK